MVPPGPGRAGLDGRGPDARYLGHAGEAMLNGISLGWQAVLANLKSLLETGEALPQAPWEMSRAHA